MIQLREERIPKKMLQTKMEGKRPRGRPRTRWMDLIRKDIKIRDENWKEMQENRKWENRNKIAGDFSVIVNPFFGNDLRITMV